MDRRIQRAIAHAAEHLGEPLSLAHLSDVAGMDRFRLHRQLKECAGISPKRLLRLLHLKRASLRLVFHQQCSVTEVALDAGFSAPEAFTRAFTRAIGQSPRAFRHSPNWPEWRRRICFFEPRVGESKMEVQIVDLADIAVAAMEHRGAPQFEYDTVRKFLQWRLAHRLVGEGHRSYGLHYNDPRTAGDNYHMDVCVSVTRPISDAAVGVVMKTIQGGRYARARHIGSRDHVLAAPYLHGQWLPSSGETMRDAPIVFHYVNVGPNVREHEMITDVYLPLK